MMANHVSGRESDAERFAYESDWIEAEPALRLGGAFAVLNCVCEIVLMSIRQRVEHFSRDASPSLRDFAALIIDLGLGVLLVMRVRGARSLLLIRASAAVFLPVVFFFVAPDVSWEACGILTTIEGLYLAAVSMVLLGSPGLGRKSVACILFLAHVVGLFAPLAIVAR